jgi:DNA-binding transcriptional MocR family regulator
MCREKCLLIMDEFYSRYNYADGCNGSSVSSAENVIDVNTDPVLILDGLTKAFRLPGWRICWILGPKEYIRALSSSGSYLDGGANVPFQKAAIPMLEPSLVTTEMAALQKHFMMKRDYCIKRLTKMGFKFKVVPNSTFYIWLDLSHLPGKAKNGIGFFQECLKERVICVPGVSLASIRILLVFYINIRFSSISIPWPGGKSMTRQCSISCESLMAHLWRLSSREWMASSVLSSDIWLRLRSCHSAKKVQCNNYISQLSCL